MVDPYHFAPMSEHPLPTMIEPFKLVVKRALVDGPVELDSLPRLCDELANKTSQEGFAEVELAFQRDQQGFATASGYVRAIAGVVCQRCLGVVSIPLEASVSWAFITDEAAFEDVPKAYDAIMVEDEAISLIDLIEDELLLALPPVPMHEEGECKAPDQQPHDEGFASGGEVKKNPFEVLAEFKKKS